MNFQRHLKFTRTNKVRGYVRGGLSFSSRGGGKELLKEGAAWMAGKLIFPESEDDTFTPETDSRPAD